MRVWIVTLLLPLVLAGCLSIERSAPPNRTTVVAPPGSTVVCDNATRC